MLECSPRFEGLDKELVAARLWQSFSSDHGWDGEILTVAVCALLASLG